MARPRGDAPAHHFRHHAVELADKATGMELETRDQISQVTLLLAEAQVYATLALAAAVDESHT